MRGIVPGSVLGPYEIVAQVGRGGMATVYKAYQPSLSRYVAIKVLPEFFANEPGFRERFQQEAVAIAQFRHPNIVAVHDLARKLASRISSPSSWKAERSLINSAGLYP